MRVATIPEEGRPIQATTLSRTVGHVDVLLRIIATTDKSFLIGTDPGETVDVDPSMKAENFKTYSMAHSRLRDVLDDQARWAAVNSAEDEQILSYLDTAKRVDRQRTITLRESSRPCFLLRAQVMRATLNDEPKWCAWHGSPEPQNGGLVGWGNTPNEAFRDFDRAYNQRRSKTDKIQQPHENE